MYECPLCRKEGKLANPRNHHTTVAFFVIVHEYTSKYPCTSCINRFSSSKTKKSIDGYIFHLLFNKFYFKLLTSDEKKQRVRCLNRLATKKRGMTEKQRKEKNKKEKERRANFTEAKREEMRLYDNARSKTSERLEKKRTWSLVENMSKERLDKERERGRRKYRELPEDKKKIYNENVIKNRRKRNENNKNT